MGNRPSAFRRQVLRHLPLGAHYYYLVRYSEHGAPMRVPAIGALQATPIFQDPPKPGAYVVEYCQDPQATRPVKTKACLLVNVTEADTARVGGEEEHRRFLRTVRGAAPEGATHYYLATLDGTEGPDGLLKLWSRFQYPALAAAGWWEVRYCGEHAERCARRVRPTLVALREPIASRGAAVQAHAQTESRADMLSLLDRHYELNRELRSTLRTLADQWSRIEGHYQRAASAPDYTAVLKYLADSIREAVRLPTGSVPVAQQAQASDCVGKPAAGSASAAAIAAAEAATLQAIAEVRKSAARPKRSSPEKLEAEADAQIAEALIMRDPDFRLNRAHLIELERKPT